VAIFRSFVLACKSDKAPDDGRVASATTISVFQTHAEPESARLRTTSVEPLRLEIFGRSLFILIYPYLSFFGLSRDSRPVSEKLTFIENTADFGCKFVGRCRVLFFPGQLQQFSSRALESAKQSNMRYPTLTCSEQSHRPISL
jgi:hypothetical protein